MPKAAGIWTESFRVRSYEMDLHGLASVQTLCNYFQEAAGNHAQAFGVSMAQLGEAGLTWVLARLYVQIDIYPQWGDTVRIETWPSGVEGLFANRDFLFFQTTADTDEAVCIGRGTSAWLVLDIARKRPVRVPATVTELILPDRPRALDTGFNRLQPIAEADHTRRFGVRYSDLDINQHVNNVRYAEWAVETVPEAVWHAHQLHTLELHFRAETTFGDIVITKATQDTDGDALVFDHTLTRASDERDVALARSRWLPGR